MDRSILRAGTRKRRIALAAALALILVSGTVYGVTENWVSPSEASAARSAITADIMYRNSQAIGGRVGAALPRDVTAREAGVLRRSFAVSGNSQPSTFKTDVDVTSLVRIGGTLDASFDETTSWMLMPDRVDTAYVVLQYATLVQSNGRWLVDKIVCQPAPDDGGGDPNGWAGAC